MAVLANEVLDAGHFRRSWNGADDRGGVVASGVYFVSLETGTDREIRRLVRMR